MRTPTVYLIAQPTVPRKGGKLPDLTPLAAHGDIKVLITPGEYPAFHPERALKLIRQRLAEFDPAIDYIAWAGGDTLSAVLTGIVLMELECTGVTWLRHERGRDPKDPSIRTDEGSHYTPVDIDFLPPQDENQLHLDIHRTGT